MWLMSIQNYNQIYIFKINLMSLLPVHLLAIENWQQLEKHHATALSLLTFTAPACVN